MNAEDLIARIRAQLDENERVALAATPGPWSAHGLRDAQHLDHDPITEYEVWGDPGYGGFDDVASLTISASIDDDGQISELFPRKERQNAEHIAKWDPARVIADVKAKRALVNLAEQMLAPVPVPPGYPAEALAIKTAVEDGEARAAIVLLKILAVGAGIPVAPQPDCAHPFHDDPPEGEHYEVTSGDMVITGYRCPACGFETVRVTP